MGKKDKASKKERRPSTESQGSVASVASVESVMPSTKMIHIDHLRQLVSGKQLSLKDFDLRNTVGCGSFGRVRVAKVKKNKDRTPFALKIMKKSEVIRLKQVENVKAEVALLDRISHPFIVNLMNCFQDEKRLFLVLEFVNGGELFSQLRKKQRLPNADARFYSGEVTLAFSYIHGRDIIYRDLKPENLLIDSEGHMKVTDFGFAKVVPDRTFTLCGTPEYLAPEIIQNKGHGKAVDWWAMGILIFEMLAGYTPWQADSAMEIYELILGHKIDWPKHFDKSAKDLIKQLLEVDKAKRLGVLKDGVEDIQQHKWYKDINWERLLARELTAPFIPKVRAPDDTSMFDRYPESTEDSAKAISAVDQAKFEDFDTFAGSTNAMQAESKPIVPEQPKLENKSSEKPDAAPEGRADSRASTNDTDRGKFLFSL